jgi:hypothetical protein
MDACIEYHDDNRLFPIGVLMKPGWHKNIPDAPTILTINQARGFTDRLAELASAGLMNRASWDRSG